MPYASNSVLTGELPAKAIDEFLAVTGPGSGSPLVSVELRHLGGALGRTGPHHGAVSKLPGSLRDVRRRDGADAGDPGRSIQAHADRAAASLAPYEAGHYSNFTEESGGAGRFFGGETWDRLRAVKGEYDPGTSSARTIRSRRPSSAAGDLAQRRASDARASAGGKRERARRRALSSSRR